MGAFLQIVGAVFVALILVALAVIFFLKWKINAWAGQMVDRVTEFGGIMEKMAAQGGPMAAALRGDRSPDLSGRAR